MPSYTVQEGDQLSGLAAKFGFLDFNTIWNDAGNADLKKKRQDPHILMPGDVLNIPIKQVRTESADTGKVHTYTITAKPLNLKIVIQDFDNSPMPGLECTLVVEDQTFKLKSDAKGMIQAAIPRTAKTGQLTIPDIDIDVPVQIGFLDPYDEDSGWQARLINLGYYNPSDDSDDGDQLEHAIEEFQCDHNLPVTGELDDSTRSQLQTQHGS